MSLLYSGTGALKTDYTRTGKRSVCFNMCDVAAVVAVERLVDCLWWFTLSGNRSIAAVWSLMTPLVSRL